MKRKPDWKNSADTTIRSKKMESIDESVIKQEKMDEPEAPLSPQLEQDGLETNDIKIEMNQEELETNGIEIEIQQEELETNNIKIEMREEELKTPKPYSRIVFEESPPPSRIVFEESPPPSPAPRRTPRFSPATVEGDRRSDLWTLDPLSMIQIMQEKANTHRIESTKAWTTEVKTMTSRRKTNAQRCREYRERQKLQNTMVQNITAERSDECSGTDQLQAKKPKTNAERRKKHYEAQKLKKKESKKLPKTVKQKNKEYYERKKKIQAVNTLNHHSDAEGKGKGTEPDHRQWFPCPLLPGVPSIPLPVIPRPWEVLRSDETTAAAENDNDIIKGVPSMTPLVILQGPLPETTAAPEDDDDDVVEGTSPSRTLQGPFPGLTVDHLTKRVEEIDDLPTAPLAKKRRISSSPSTGVIQTTALPANPVLADFEFINCTLSSSTSRMEALGSGWSAMSNNSLEIDVDLDRDLGSDANSGSETEEENRPLLNTRNAVVGDLDEPNPTEAADLMRLDAAEDQAVRDMAAGDVDVLRFDWCSEYTNFQGVREEFTGPSGPTFDHSGMSPLRVFEQIWDTSIIDHIVRETNNYARELQCKRAGKLVSRMSRWKDTTREEIWRFLSILMLQSLVVNNVEREYWFPSNDHMRIGNFGKLMSFNRFLLIKRCLYFTDNSSLPEHPSKLDKIMPIIAHLNKKFGSLYLPEQNVAIDESLLLWKGRLSFSQKNSSKRAREGIKSFEVWESRTGYLWKMEVFSGKGHVHGGQEGAGAVKGQEAGGEPASATSQVVFNLMRPLFGKGHTLVMDSYYNSPLLSRLLKSTHQTDTMGTLRLNREFVPEGLKVKTKKNMKSGEVCFSSTKDLCVLVYMDKNIVPMISTFHQPEVGGIVKYGYYKYRPKVILDYNLSMGGIDRKDQLLSSFPMERRRNLCWYKKLFRRLLNVSIHNASVIHDHGRTGFDKLGNRPFRMQLVKEMLETYCDTPRPLQPPPTLSQMHLPVKVKRQRCKLCYRHKVRRTTVWSCGTCRVNLCIEGCYAEYHRQPQFS